MDKILLFIFLVLILSSCAGPRPLVFQQTPIPDEPDYSKDSQWAALPWVSDNADLSPDPSLPNNQDDAKVDVFYIHPTTLTAKKAKKQWNARLNDIKLNEKTDKTAIKYQASSMNGAGKVYAPRYRQAHINSYYTRDTLSANKAFDLAYSDITKAFDYYLEHYNKGRPFIIAAHSQGTQHAGRLIKERIEGTLLKDRLVVAYLVGMPVPLGYFEDIPLCEEPMEIQCFCSWRSYKRGHYPDDYIPDEPIAINNPLSWKTNNDIVPKKYNEGAVLQNFNKIRPEIVDAEIHDGLLWMNKPKFPWSFLFFTKNYHIGDYNLFYVNIRNNAILRTKSYLRKKLVED